MPIELTEEQKELLKDKFCTNKYPNKNALVHPDAKKINADPQDLWYRRPYCGFEAESWPD